MTKEFEDPKGIAGPDLLSFIVDNDVTILIHSEIPDVPLELEGMDGNSSMTQVAEEKEVCRLNMFYLEINSEREIRNEI